ncbi:hypothetical protein [Luteibacter aegosomatissinici]|uniref:hypothetical protein n=1 Tax=Luteibacter aegosomatissinici TaxID=2911539 RepID=UPI001FF8F7E4|nr:hypothetical protein [Luteibacter aegosomatissinici]UPG96306.1 hypothetical protein L2Y97_09405 [Luteibacter aegosomatissinici]
MTTKRLTLAVLATCALPAHAADRYAGDASPRDGGPVLYREVHLVDGSRQVVSYQCPDGKPFALKVLDAARDPTQPNVTYQDARRGLSETVQASGSQLDIKVRKKGGDEQARTIDVPQGAVIDAGFDPYIRSHWDSLGAGVSVPFLVASRFRFFDVKILGGKVADGQRHLVMKLDAWYAFAAPTIEMTYGAADRRLLRYEGMGTVRNAKGKGIEVRIDFPPSGRTMGLPSSALDDVIHTPLSGTCAT